MSVTKLLTLLIKTELPLLVCILLIVTLSFVIISEEELLKKTLLNYIALLVKMEEF